MFSVGPNYSKLKTNLRLAVNRLKLLGKKKSELTQKARKEISDYILEHKEDRARIKVEHIIHEDYMVEAYELLEMYCDTLLARFGLIQQMKELDEGLEEAINSVCWAAPRLLAEIQEFKIISEQLAIKYGKPFVEQCRCNGFNKVNPKLLAKMSVHAPPKVLVERYMMEIAKSHGVPFTPDQSIIREDEVANAEAMLIDFQNKGQQGYGYQYPPVPHYNNMGGPGPGEGPPPPGAPGPGGYPGPPPFNYPPPGNGGAGGGGGGMSQPMVYPQFSVSLSF